MLKPMSRGSEQLFSFSVAFGDVLIDNASDRLSYISFILQDDFKEVLDGNLHSVM